MGTCWFACTIFYAYLCDLITFSCQSPVILGPQLSVGQGPWASDLSSLANRILTDAGVNIQTSQFYIQN